MSAKFVSGSDRRVFPIHMFPSVHPCQDRHDVSFLTL